MTGRGGEREEGGGNGSSSSNQTPPASQRTCSHNAHYNSTDGPPLGRHVESPSPSEQSPPTSALSSFAAVEHVLPSITSSTPQGIRAAGLTTSAISPKFDLHELSIDSRAERKDGNSEAEPNSPEVRSPKMRRRKVASPKILSVPRRTGVCKFFNAQKGFGFVLDDAADEVDNEEIFVHYTTIVSVQSGPSGFRSLLEVEYAIVQGPKGWQAQDVTGPGGVPCIGSLPSSSGGAASTKGNQTEGRRRSEGVGLPSRRSSVLPLDQVVKGPSRSHSTSAYSADFPNAGGRTYDASSGSGPFANAGYGVTPETYQSGMVSPYAHQDIYSSHYGAVGLARHAPEVQPDHYAYATYSERRPSQVLTPPFLYPYQHASPVGYEIPSMALAQSPTRAHFPTSYAPPIHPVAYPAVPPDAAFIPGLAHDPYAYYPAYGLPSGIAADLEPQVYPISSNRPE
ncbi:hypothetical protein JCM10908_001219 [Rhodotorula pacifica]|uniref:cold-shock protein n=1 Tax=Rhodotorula pacifica TaxID=1495444 RepID=UPI0031741026